MCEKYLNGNEECYETKEDCIDDLIFDDLIKEAEISPKLWKRINIEEFPDDIDSLKRQLQHSEKQLDFVSRVGSQLLLKINKLTDENEQLKEQITRVSEEIIQMKYSVDNRRMRMYEDYDGNDESETFSESYDIEDDKSMDAKSCCSMDLRNQSTNLELVNSLIEDEIHILQKKMDEEINLAKIKAYDEVKSSRKLIKNLEEKLQLKELELAKCQTRYSECTQIVDSLHTTIKELEEEVDHFQEIFDKNKQDRIENNKLIAELTKEKIELSQLNSDLTQQLKQLRRSSQPRVLRHVTDANSPYVQSNALSQEILQQASHNSLYEPLTSSFNFWQKYQKQSDNFTSKTETKSLFRAPHCRKLGQPGRLGTHDLDHALDNLRPVMYKSNNDLTKSPRYSYYNKPFTELEMKNSFSSNISNILNVQPHKLSSNLFSNLSVSCQDLSKSVLSSRLLAQWRNLGTPNLSKLFQPQLGIFTKGSTNNCKFIEENFSDCDSVISFDSFSTFSNNNLLGNFKSPAIVSNDLTMLEDNIDNHIVTTKVIHR